MITSYKDLDVWKKAIELVEEIYVATRKFPKEELYGIINQMRRSAISIPSNIAEGKTRQHVNEYVQFLYIALGSCAELETQVIIACKLGYLIGKQTETILEKIDHVARMARNLVKSLR